MNNVCVIFLNFQCSNNHASVDPEYDSVDNASTPSDNNVKSIRSVGIVHHPNHKKLNLVISGVVW